jgi:hypothetical protein
MNAPLSSVAEPPDLDQLANDELHATARQLVCGSNQLLATLLAHLGEIEARGIHRERACSSLYTYCVYELRMSEDAAYRRARAARLVRAYPAALRAIADGELHLTGLLLLAPHPSEESHEELLALAKHRSKRELLALVRRIAPEPEMAPKLEPIGRALGLVPRAPTWKQFVTALCPPVRELDPGARPKDWTIATDGTEDHVAPGEALGAPVPFAHDETRAGAGAAADSADEIAPADGAPAGSATGSAGSSEADADAAATEPAPGMPPLRYKVQFTASQRYAELVERACDLLSHAVPSRSSPTKFGVPGMASVARATTRNSVARMGARKAMPPRRSSVAGPLARAASTAMMKNSAAVTSAWLTICISAPLAPLPSREKMPRTMKPSWAIEE